MPTEAWEIRMQCAAADAPRVTTVRLEQGYSTSTGQPCVVATARNNQGDLVSETVTRSYPLDCVAVPEAPLQASVALGLALLALLSRARR
jgi:hypothetical protein